MPKLWSQLAESTRKQYRTKGISPARYNSWVRLGSDEKRRFRSIGIGRNEYLRASDIKSLKLPPKPKKVEGPSPAARAYQAALKRLNRYTTLDSAIEAAKKLSDDKKSMIVGYGRTRRTSTHYEANTHNWASLNGWTHRSAYDALRDMLQARDEEVFDPHAEIYSVHSKVMA